MREEYETICRRYYNKIYLFLLKLCKSRELAEDLTQETFYRAILSLHRFEGKSDVFTFLAAIAKHTYYKHLRKNKHTLDSVSLSDMAEYLADSDIFDPAALCERASREMAVRTAVDKLPEKYRDVVLYRIYADMTFAQTAAAMGITENSAKVLFCRAKKKLSEELQNGNHL